MHVSQVAYDRFVVELPPADADFRPLADPETVAETAAWLWDFGPKPLIAVVGYDGAAPSWLTAWSTSPVKWAPRGAKTSVALVLNTREDLERFLSVGAPHERTVLMWPSVSDAKTFEALHAGGNAWLTSIDAHAQISEAGQRFEVNQVAPA